MEDFDEIMGNLERRFPSFTKFELASLAIQTQQVQILQAIKSDQPVPSYYDLDNIKNLLDTVVAELEKIRIATEE